MQCSSHKKRRRKAPTGNGPQQPANVVTRSAAQGMQRIAQRALHPTAIHAVVGLGVADSRFNGLATLEQALFMGTERLVLAPVDDLHAWVVGIDPSVAQIDHHLFGLAPEVLN